MEPIQERSGGSGGEVPGETMEIKIKTLDSQSYTIRVAKNVSVSSVWKLSPISYFFGELLFVFGYGAQFLFGVDGWSCCQ
jgi:hypothetical protein